MTDVMTDQNFQLWACEETALVEYLSKRERFDLAAIERATQAFFGSIPKSTKPQILSVSNGVATIKIAGVLSPNGPDIIDRLFGFEGTAYGDIITAIESSVDDPNVQSIRLAINSPGGDVEGVDETRATIAAAARQKPVVALNTGRVASAAYWLASAADEIVATSPANMTGSIGVVAVAIDRTDRDRKYGVVTVVSKNAPDKRPDLQTESGISVLQDQVDAIERVFTARVSEGRGVSIETVERTFGRGRMLIASDPDASKPTALSVGMIDKVESNFGASLKPGRAEVAAIEGADLSAETNDEPPCAAEGETMSEELKAKIAELEKELGNTGAAQEELRSRMAAVAPILASDAYPNAIKEIAARVLAGAEHPKMLEGAIAMLDAKRAENEIAVAKSASDAAPVGEPKPSVAIPADGSIVSAESLEASVRSMRRALGKE